MTIFLLCPTSAQGQVSLQKVESQNAPSSRSANKGNDTNSEKAANGDSGQAANGDSEKAANGDGVKAASVDSVKAANGDSVQAANGDSGQVEGPIESSGHARIKTKNSLKAPVHYQAADSMIMMHNGIAYLHGKGELKYESMELQSDYIRMNMDSSLIYARGVYDSLEYEWKGKPVFKDGKDSYETNEITYNIKTQKGYIRHVVTQQGEGYIIADRTKKLNNDEMLMAGGQYTTCDDHEHPHFYLNLTKAKVKAGDYIASGPAYLVVGDVPLPIAVPFGFFPFTDKYSSGLIMPNFGDDYTRGLYLQNLGYYFALSDYIDLELTGDIYTRGTWAIRAKSKYIWRYRFSGNLSINYRNDVTGERGLPDYAASKNFSVTWSHSQDAKFNPYSTFSASVNFSTSGYNRSNINSYYNSNLYSENTKSSTINYTQRFPDSPWSLSMSANLTQRTKDSTLTLTAPQLTVTMSSVYPFKQWRQATLKRKGKVGGKEKWYEKIKMSYTLNGKIAVNNIKEKDFLHSDFLRDWQTGISHNLPINASFTLFKYLSITPNINIRDKMYFTRIDQRWDEEINGVARDTTTGFFNVFDFDVGVSMSTKLYGFYTPLKKLFPNSKVEKFRHVITPTLSFSYHPDFGTSGWGYWGSYDQPIYTNEIDSITGKKIPKTDESGNPVFESKVYSRFANGSFGSVSRGMSASLNFGVSNNLEMKIVNKEDTTGKVPFRVVSLIDNFSINGGYNFAADSMNWSQFSVNLRLKFPKLNNYSLNLNTTLDPYMFEIVNGSPRRTNKQYWNNGRFPHWSGLRWSFSYTFSNSTIKKWKDKINGRKPKNDEPPEEEETDVGSTGTATITAVEKDAEGMDRNAKRSSKKKEEKVDDGYVKTDFPWSLSINYSLAYAPGGEFDYEKMYYKMKFSNYLSLNGNIGLGKGWKVSASMTYNFDYKKVTACTVNISRDLHCWNMTASINPIGQFKSYTFHIGVNASILSDLKYDTNSNQRTNSRVNWW